MKKDNKYTKLLDKHRKSAKGALVDLDYIDALPKTSPAGAGPFPYGGSEARPYGWSSATLSIFENEKNAY